MVQQYFQRNVRPLLLASLAIVWIALWRLPFLQGDDRYFAVASSLPHGRQTIDGIRSTINLTWYEFNGRLADGLGPVYFAGGDVVLRLVMAGAYVLFAGLLWLWLKELTRNSEHSLPSLVKPDWRTLVTWLLVAAIPFLIAGIQIKIAGQSVFLMAAVWNYIIPLDLILLALYPLVRCASGRPTPWWIQVPSLALLIPALAMHEMLTVYTIGLVIGLVLVLGRRVFRVRPLLVLLAVAVGTVIKLRAPGLWARVTRPDNIGDDFARSGYEVVVDKVRRAAALLASLPTYYLFLVLVFLLVLIVLLWVSPLRTDKAMAPLTLSSGIALSMLFWLWASRRHLYAGAMDGDKIPGSSIPPGVLLPVLVGAAAVWGFVALTVAALRDAGVVVVGFAGFTVAVAVTAVMNVTYISEVGRTSYVVVLSLAILVVSTLVHGITTNEVDGKMSAVLNGLTSVVLAVSVAGFSSSLNQLLINRAAWNLVEDQIVAAKAGASNAVEIPMSVPCADLSWYFWPPHEALTLEQIRTYYGLDERVRITPVPNMRPCLPD